MSLQSNVLQGNTSSTQLEHPSISPPAVDDGQCQYVVHLFYSIL